MDNIVTDLPKSNALSQPISIWSLLKLSQRLNLTIWLNKNNRLNKRVSVGGPKCFLSISASLWIFKERFFVQNIFLFAQSFSATS